MRCVFRVSDGRYCDSSESHPKGISDVAIIKSGNVMGRNGGVEADYVVVETRDPMPQLCKLVAGKVVRDADLEALKTARDGERMSAIMTRQVNADRCAEIKAKAAAGVASLAEMNEFIAKM